MTKKFENMDANESIYFARELEHVKARTYDVVYPEIMYPRVFPISSEVSPAAKTITYRQYDMVGHAKLIHNYANDLPVANVKGKEFTSQVYSEGISYGYSIQDIRESQMAGKGLETRLAASARRAVELLTNDLAFFGDPATSLQPFLNNDNVNYYTVKADGTGSSKLWKDKTPDLIVRDIGEASTLVRTVSKATEVVNTLLLADAEYGHIATTRMGDGSDVTILDFVLRTNPWISTIMPCYELDGACAGTNAGADAGSSIGLMYNNSADKLTLEIPQPFEQFAPQEKALYYEIACHARIGGVLIYYPKSIVQLNGIGEASA